jgi:hypothetical protein
MREEMERRLRDLTAEYGAGQQLLADLEARRAKLTTTMARISGAIQVLEELLGETSSDAKPFAAVEPSDSGTAATA